MSRRKNAKADPAASDAWTCPHCKERLPRAFAIGDPPPVPVHCVGSGRGWRTPHVANPHHGRTAYLACWRCHQGLGCDQCAGPVTEVLCKSCAVWGTPEALAAHGPVLDVEPMRRKRKGVRAPGIDDYPAHFQHWYDEAMREAQAVQATAVQSVAAAVALVAAHVGTVAPAMPDEASGANGASDDTAVEAALLAALDDEGV